MYIFNFLLLLFFSSVIADNCDKALLPASRLRSDLLCGYDPNLAPLLNHKNSVQLVLRLLVKYFNFDIHDNQFVVDTWISMLWMDEHLKWDPTEYDSIKKLHFSHSDIWMPDISVYNRREQGGTPGVIESASCSVNFQGQVVCVPSCRLTSLCTPDLTKYPYDSHNCTVRIGSWVHSGEELDIRIATPPVTVEDMEPNGEWTLDLVNVYKHPGVFKCCPNNTYPSIYYSFAISRIPGAHTASIVLPALALIIITLTSLWISPNHTQRLAICYVNLICEFLYAQYVSYLLPMNGDNIPLILLFARDSLFLCTFTIVFSVLLKNMVETAKPAPVWISRVVSIVSGHKLGQRALLNATSFKGVQKLQEDDGAAIINTHETENQNTDWLMFAKILDILLFFIYLIVYLCMFIAFML